MGEDFGERQERERGGAISRKERTMIRVPLSDTYSISEAVLVELLHLLEVLSHSLTSTQQEHGIGS